MDKMKRKEYQQKVRVRRIVALSVAAVVLIAAVGIGVYGHWKNTGESDGTTSANATSEDADTSSTTDESDTDTSSTTVESDTDTSGQSYAKQCGYTDPGLIFNTQKNENGEYRNGQEGDQTGKEARIMSYPDYYVDSSYPWSFLLRCTDKKVRAQAVENAIAAADNDHIGYDSGDLRMTLWDAAVDADYDFSKIDMDCSANCVTSALIFYKAAGYQLGIEALQNIDISIHVWDVNETLLATGLFQELDDESYLHTVDYGYAGDLYVAESRHVMMQVTDGIDPK